MKLYKVEYLGYATADRRLSPPMIPWILAEIRKGSFIQKVSVGVKNGSIVCYPRDARARDPPSMSHPLHLVCRHIVIHGNVTTFGYFLRDLAESILYCYLFQTTEPDDIIALSKG